MRSIKVLEMINNGRIEDLKKELQDEIYTESLGKGTDAKKRYASMKRYFTYMKPIREALQKPCEVTYENEKYISFCNGCSLSLTTETCGEMQLNEDPDRYPNVSRLINLDGDEYKIDFNKIFADAKSKGYKLKKSELDGVKYKYLFKYQDTYFKLGLLDLTFSIIDDGKEATIYYRKKKAPITIKTSIGICIVMPMNLESEDILEESNLIVIEEGK